MFVLLMICNKYYHALVREKVCRVLDPFGNLWWINQRIEGIDFIKSEEIGQRASTPEAIEGINYIQKSIDEAFKAQKRFLKHKKLINERERFTPLLFIY